MKCRIVVVSLFSGIDLFLKGFVKLGMLPAFACEVNKYAAKIHAANFLYINGTPVLTPEIETTLEEIKQLEEREGRDLKDEWWIKDERYYRYKRVEELNGKEIRELCEQKFGKNIKIILIAGPPCQDMSGLNQTADWGRSVLTLQFLRILEELQPEIGLMEEIKRFLSKKNKILFDTYIDKASTLPYNFAYMVMNALHYGEGRQSRERVIFPFIRKDIGMPVFPEPSVGMAKRFGELIDADRFFSGHFTDRIRTKNDFMGTVTSGSPLWFEKNLVQRKPTFDGKMFFQGVDKGDYIIPAGIPEDQLSIAAGNGVCVNLSYALGKTILGKILRLKHIGNGWFVPIDTPDDGSGTLNNNDCPAPVACPDDTSVATILPDLSNAIIHPDSIGEANSSPMTKPAGQDAKPAESGVIPPPVVNNAPPENKLANTAINKPEEGNSVPPEDKPAPIVILNPPATILPKSGAININTPKRGTIITSEQLLQMKFVVLGFHDKWNNFFGNPTPDFYLIIHGIAGGGKSTFAVQYAKYLSENHGKTLFISGEEGISKTLMDKFANTNSMSPSLHVVELKSSVDIFRVVQPGAYHFILIEKEKQGWLYYNFIKNKSL